MTDLIMPRYNIINRDGHNINLVFKHNCTLVDGDSSIGKSYIYDCINTESKLGLNNIICCNEDSKVYGSGLLALFKDLNNRVILVDNADIVLTNGEKEFVTKDKRNQYILIARWSSSFGVSLKNIANLKYDETKDLFYLEYEFEEFL